MNIRFLGSLVDVTLLLRLVLLALLIVEEMKLLELLANGDSATIEIDFLMIMITYM